MAAWQSMSQQGGGGEDVPYVRQKSGSGVVIIEVLMQDENRRSLLTALVDAGGHRGHPPRGRHGRHGIHQQLMEKPYDEK